MFKLNNLKKIIYIFLLFSSNCVFASNDFRIGTVSESSALNLFSGYGTDFCRVDIRRVSDNSLVAVVRNSSVIMLNINERYVAMVLYKENGGFTNSTKFSFNDRDADPKKPLSGKLLLSTENKNLIANISFIFGDSKSLYRVQGNVTDSCTKKDGQFGKKKSIFTGIFKWLIH